MSKRLLTIGICSSAYFLTSGCAHHHEHVRVRQPVPAVVVSHAPPPVSPPVETVIVQAPPAQPTEVIPPAPGSGYVWVPGYWSWSNDNWVWVSGYWGVPPRASATWHPGRWRHERHGYRWEPGHWR